MTALSRRDALRLLAAVGGALRLPEAAGVHPPPVARFSPEAEGVLRELLATLYGPGGEGLDAVEALAETLGYVDEERQALIVDLPRVFDQLSRVLVPTGEAWSALEPAERERALADWERSPLGFRRSIYQALRQLLLFHAHSDPAAWPTVGYPGPWLGRLELPVHPPRFGGEG